MDILFVNLPFSGHTNPTLPLAEALVSRGHNVVYINAEEFRHKIENTGARFVPYINYPENPSEQKKKTSCFRAAFDTAMALEEHSDLLVYEMFFYPGIEIAKRKNIPCVRQFSQPAWSVNTWKNASPVFRFSAGLIDAQVMGGGNKKHMGMSGSSMKDVIISSRPQLNIVYVPEVFQKNREDFGDDYVFAVPPSKSLAGAEIPYDGMKHPIVYISLGSIISNKGFCKECIRAFGGKPVSVILNTGRVSIDSLGRVPDNIHAYSFVPQTEVLEHADVFLTHCGMNSVNEALTAGVPMVAMPFINDQTENASRLVSMGLAKRVRSFPSRGRELYEAVISVSRDKQMKEKAEAVRAEITGKGCFGTLAERVESIVS